MGCRCNEKKVGQSPTYEVTTADGGKITVRSEAAAIIAAKKSGGTYRQLDPA